MRKTRKNTKGTNWKAISEILGGLTAFAGAVIMIGACGSLYLETLTLRDAILLCLLGLSMLAVGCFALKDVECPSEWLDEEDLPEMLEELIGAMAYNTKYRSWMTLVDYKHDENWTFVLCSRSGRPESTPVRTHENIMNYKWTN